MPEILPRVLLVRCPKCDHLLPEFPLYSVYRCGGCGALSRAEKRSSVDDGLSEKSWEERIGEVSEREGYGENVGFDRGRDNDRSATSSMVSRYGDATRNSPIRESDSGDLGSGSRKSSTKPTVLGDFDVQSKSSGRSMDGDLTKSPLRESSLGGLDGRGNSSARSVRGGVRKTPIRESMPGDFDEQRAFERDVGDPKEMEARVKVGAWIDHVEKEVEYANRFVTQKGSPDQLLDYEASADESEVSGPQVQPRRTWRLDKHPMDSGLSPRGVQAGRRADLFVDGTESEYEELYSRRGVEILHDDWVPGGDHRLPRGHRDVRAQDGYVGELWGQRDEMEQWKVERNEFVGVHGYNSVASVQKAEKRFPVHPIDGPSNFHSYYGYNQSRQSHERFSGSSGLWNAEMNRAELLRQYNELEGHLSRTGDFPENPTKRGHQSISSSDFYGGLDYDVQDKLLRSRRPTESVGLDERARMRPHHMNNSQVAGGFANDRLMGDINSFPPSRLVPNEVPSDDDPSWPQYPRRTPHGRPHYYPQRSAHDCIPRRSIDSTYDPSGLTPQNEVLHHPRNLQTNVQAPPAFGHRRYLNPRTDLAFDFPDPYGESASGSRFPYSTPNLSSHSQRSVDSKSDGGGSAQEHSKRVLVVKKNQLLCHPIAGAAPLVICYNCSQLLRVPKKLIAMKKTQFRLQCGSCRTTLSFSFDKKPHASMQLQPKPNLTNVDDVPSKMSESDHKKSLTGSPAGITKSESYEFDATGYTFQSTDSEPSLQLDSRRLNSSEAQKQYEPSMLLDNAVNENDKKLYEKETDASGHDKGSTITDVLNADAPTELDLNSDEIPIPDMSQSSTEASSKNDGGGNKIGKSSSAGIIARAFRDLSPPTDTSNAKDDVFVFVNGQPLPHRVVRKAEKLAGPISPGKYWYDSRAGFWGVMGSYCLGIIPPFIQEFGFPMPINCAGGTTGIYVNGRELHEKDLQLLASRRLPLARNKWYVIDISGKVEDEETGDTVVNMGKLAPSVEKAKHGFGMQPPEMREE